MTKTHEQKPTTVEEAKQPDSRHSGIVLPIVLTPKEYIPYSD